MGGEYGERKENMRKGIKENNEKLVMVKLGKEVAMRNKTKGDETIGMRSDDKICGLLIKRTYYRLENRKEKVIFKCI